MYPDRKPVAVKSEGLIQLKTSFVVQPQGLTYSERTSFAVNARRLDKFK